MNELYEIVYRLKGFSDEISFEIIKAEKKDGIWELSVKVTNPKGADNENHE